MTIRGLIEPVHTYLANELSVTVSWSLFARGDAQLSNEARVSWLFLGTQWQPVLNQPTGGTAVRVGRLRFDAVCYAADEDAAIALADKLVAAIERTHTSAVMAVDTRETTPKGPDARADMCAVTVPVFMMRDVMNVEYLLGHIDTVTDIAQATGTVDGEPEGLYP